MQYRVMLDSSIEGKVLYSGPLSFLECASVYPDKHTRNNAAPFSGKRELPVGHAALLPGQVLLLASLAVLLASLAVLLASLATY